MPPELIDLFKTVLAHPAFLGGGVLVAALLASLLARAQLTHGGLDRLTPPGLDRLDFASLGGAGVFWLITTLGLGLMVSEQHLQTLVLPVFGLLVKLVEAGLVLAIVAWAAQALDTGESSRDADNQAQQRQVRTTSVVVGAFVTVALVTGSGWIPLLLLAAVISGGAWLVRDPRARSGLVGWVQDVASGLRLREHWGEGGELCADGRRVLLTGPVGLIDTPCEEDGEPGRLRNRDLARLATRLDPPHGAS